MGVASSADGRPAVAVRQLRAALRSLDRGLAQSVGDRVSDELRGRVLISLAWAEAERGNVELGFRLLDEAEPMLPAQRRGVLFGQRGLLLRRTGRDDEALRQYDAAIALLDEASEARDLAKALSNRGLLHLSAARARLARSDLRRSAEIAARRGFDLTAAAAQHNLGDLDLLAGDVPAALRMYGAVARVYETLAPGRLPELAIDRARALLAAGLFGEADRELAVALERSRQQRLSHTYADALLARAEAALLAGRPAAATRWANRGRRQFLRRDNNRRAALASLIALRGEHATTSARAAFVTRAQALAEVLDGFGLGEDGRVAGLLATRALAAAGRAEEAERKVAGLGRPRPVDRLDTRLLWRLTRAEVAESGQRRAEAFRHLGAGLADLQRYRSQLGCLDLQTGAAVHGRDLANAALRVALATGSPARVYRWSERARAQALLLPPVRPPEDPDAVADIEELRQVRHNLRQTELAGRPAGSLRSRSEVLQRRIRERSWHAAGSRSMAAPSSFRSVRADLADAAMLIYLQDGPTLFALVVVGGSARLVELGRYGDAHEAVLRLRADLDTQAGRALPSRPARAIADATRRDAATLAAAILEPLLCLVGDRDLVVVPTGVLVTVPWSMLPGCAGRPVTVTPSGTVWRAARSRLATLDLACGALPTLLVAGPGNERGEPEVRAIAQLWPNAHVLTGPSATAAATLAALDRVAIAHLAAHGHHESDNPLFSALDLTDGPLMGYDLQRSSTPAVVVLSSCDLGLSDVRPGDETLGMVTALLSAGSSAVVASVSRIADETAMTVMTGWHRALRAGRSPAAALAAAAPPRLVTGFVCFGAG